MTNEKILRLAAEEGAKAALVFLEEKRREQTKLRHDKRLRNTRLLLKNYKLLKIHCEQAVYNVQQTLASEKAIDILDSLEQLDEEAYIQSIKRSATRTRIILTHIDSMLNFYRIYCESSEKPEDSRRYRIVCMFYFEGLKMAEIGERECLDERTCYRDIKEACEKLSALLFGIDGLAVIA